MLLRTALASVLLLLGGWAAASWLTYGFQAWTDEGARRLEVALRPVTAPPITVQGPGLSGSLPALLGEDGGVTIVDFIYTHCETVCLTLGSSFQQLQAALQADRAAGAPAASLRGAGRWLMCCGFAVRPWLRGA